MRPVNGRSGSVSLMTALLLPLMIMVLALAIEVTWLSLAKVELQRTADIAAWAGAAQYSSTADAQASTGVSASLAELNGVNGAASRTWNADTLTTTDNLIIAQVVTSPKNKSDLAMKVSVSKVMTPSFARIFPGAPAFLTVTASSTVEVTPATGPPGCLVALSRTTATDIAMSGSALVTAIGCSVQANSGMALSGSSYIDVPEIDSTGSIAISGTAYVSGNVPANAPPTSDPLANYAQLQHTLDSLPQAGSAVVLGGSAGLSIDPGSYSSIGVSESAILTLNSGLYLISGNITLTGSSILAGKDVTIVSSGSLTVDGSVTISAKQPDATSTTGGIPGILFASRSTLPSAISGSATLPTGGVLYFPNSDFAMSGSFAAQGGCTQVIASTIEMSGSASITSDCTSSTGSSAPAASASIAFVQ